MPDHHQTTEDAPALLQRPPVLTGSPVTLTSLFIGLPVVSAAIFGAGLWLGRQWGPPSSPASPTEPDAAPTHRTVVAALQQRSPAMPLKTVAPRHPSSTLRSTDEIAKSTPKLPMQVVATSPNLPNDLWPAQFESDAEGWRVIKASQTPEDIADFIAAFPASPLVSVARARLQQLQTDSSAVASDDLRQPIPPTSEGEPQVASPDSPPVTPLQVRYAQVSLRLAGFAPGPIDGILGQRTLAALGQYQASRDLPVTGGLDAATQQALQVPSHPVLAAWQQAHRPAYSSLAPATQNREDDGKIGRQQSQSEF